MRPSIERFWRLFAVVAAVVMIAAACGDDDDDTTETVVTEAPAATTEAAADEPADTEAPAETEAPADTEAPEQAAPAKIGLIAQDEELLAFPEVRGASQAYVDYANAELDDGQVELVVCGAGDAPEGHVACAQEFVNDDSINVVITAGFGPNSSTAAGILSENGVPAITLGNDFVDYLTPGVFTFDPGLPGLAQVFFVFASQERGDTSGTLFIADDPAFEPFIPALQAIADSNGINLDEVVPLGFEPDLTGPVSAADSSRDMWFFLLADGAQCTAAASAVDTVGFEGNLYANDLCTAADTISDGSLDGWISAIGSSAPTSDGGSDVELINRILSEYGGDTQNGGLAGWALASTHVARDLVLSGGADATRESVGAALATYSSDAVPGIGQATCPGASVWTGACNMAPLIVSIDAGVLTSPNGFIQLDFGELDFLLE